MARLEILDPSAGTMGGQLSADVLFELGLMYSAGRGVELDLVNAHKWFNLAAHKGNREAIRYRNDVAREMSSADIAEAQRQAREFLSVH